MILLFVKSKKERKAIKTKEHEDSGIVSLVYAKNPYEAIELVDEFRRRAGENE